MLYLPFRKTYGFKRLLRISERIKPFKNGRNLFAVYSLLYTNNNSKWFLVLFSASRFCLISSDSQSLKIVNDLN
jgi:hypothetical protein